MDEPPRPSRHYPVLHRQLLPLIERFCPRGWLIDATVGLGGHSGLILQRCPELRILAIDADEMMLTRARENLQPWQGRVRFWQGWFDAFFTGSPGWDLLEGEAPVGVLFDFGINRLHYQSSGRGFALDADELLDMRLAADAGPSAGELVNRSSVKQLEEIFRKFGEERYAYAIARRIVRERERRPLSTARQLAEVIAASLPPAYRYRSASHPATRCFQALRIAVNDELSRLERVLPLSFQRLAPGGLLACVSFHSLEDRPVKNFFRSWQQEGLAQLLARKPLRPDEEELRENNASRSARLRVLIKEGGCAMA